MKRKLLLILCMTVYLTDALAQGPVFVVGKVLSQKDSLRVRELFLDGLQEKFRENHSRASDLFNKALAMDPANDAAMYELANISMALGQNAEAERLMRSAVTVRPENEWYWLLLAEIYKKTNRISDLLPVFEELIRLAPDKEDYYYDKANALQMLGNTDQASLVYQEIEKQFGTSEDLSAARQRILLKLGKPAQVVEELKKQIAENPDDIRNYIYLNEVYIKSGDRKRALDILEKARKIDDSNAMIRLALADNYKALNQPERTFIELKAAFADPNLNIDEKVRIVLSFFPKFSDMKARAYADELASIMTEVHPQEAKAFAVYGDVLFQEKKYPEAGESYRKALKLNDQIYQIWEQLLRIEIGKADFSQAITDGEEALAIFPNQAELYLFTGIAYAQMKNFTKAVSYLNSAADLESEDPDIRVQVFSTLGDSYNALRRYKESDLAYETALEINPDNSYVLNNYAYYLSLRGENLDKAEMMSRRSVQLNPNNASSEDTYAWILFRLKRYEDARTWIEKALRSDAANATQVEHYGDILYFLGEHELAVQQWLKAKSLGSGSDKLDKKINEKKYIE